MQSLPELKIYRESTAAQLLKPRIDDLVKKGGLDYKELNRRIVAENRTENIPVDHNPVYGGLSKEVCGVERQESYTIDDLLNSVDNKLYKLEPRKVFLKTSDTSVVADATGFFGDNLKIKVNALLNLLSTKAISMLGLPVEGVFELDKAKLIIDESIKNPWSIDFTDESNILLTINPYKQNVIPLIFRPNDQKYKGSFIDVSLLVLDERNKAVIPEIKDGTYITVAELNQNNASSFKDKKGKITTNIAGTIVGEILNSKTKQTLKNVTCDVLVGNEFPEMPTIFVCAGVDEVSKQLNTLYANVVLKQADIRDLMVVLPVKYLADNRNVLNPITSLSIEQTSVLNLNYTNSGYTFRGEPCIVDSTVATSVLSVSASNSSGDVTMTIGDVIVDGSLNLNQKSTKATVSITNSDNLISTLTKEIEVDDARPIKAKENFKATSSFAVTITDNAWNAGYKGQAWSGDSLEITGSLTKITNQFGKEILSDDILFYAFSPINTEVRILDADELYPIEILNSDSENGSTIAKATLYALLKDLSVISMSVDITVTDSRKENPEPKPDTDPDPDPDPEPTQKSGQYPATGEPELVVYAEDNDVTRVEFYSPNSEDDYYVQGIVVNVYADDTVVFTSDHSGMSSSGGYYTESADTLNDMTDDNGSGISNYVSFEGSISVAEESGSSNAISITLS